MYRLSIPYAGQGDIEDWVNQRIEQHKIKPEKVISVQEIHNGHGFIEFIVWYNV